MDRHLLYRLIGFRAGFLHGDTLVLDRWLWVRRRLPETANGERLLDVGCGSGAFTIGAARRGYDAVGVSWAEADLEAGRQRARIAGQQRASFVPLDVRFLDSKRDWAERFDVVLCLENIEHILDDRKLLQDIARCLTPGGRLLLSTPSYYYRAITPGDNGPFSQVEDGGHVRRGYTPAMLLELCREAGLSVEEISYGSGLVSQKVTRAMRRLQGVNRIVAWACSFPLRAIVPLLDNPVTVLSRYPWFCIRMVAVKPRFGPSFSHCPPVEAAEVPTGHRMVPGHAGRGRSADDDWTS